MQKKLTKTVVESLTTAGYCSDTEVKGLKVRVVCAKTNGAVTRTYIVNGRQKGKNKVISVTIGKHGVISLEQARVEAKRILALLAQGINPNDEKTEKLKAELKAEKSKASEKAFQELTLERLLLDYLNARQLRVKTSTDYKRFTKRCLGDWLKLPIVEISRDMVQSRYLELSKEHQAQANYTMRILRALFKYAIAVYEDHNGKPLLSVNPVDRLRHARLWKKVPRRQTLIRPHQLKDWYAGVMQLDNLEAQDLLLLEIFTGLRHGEAISLEWRNVDFEHKTITVEDTKNHLDLMLPMSTQVHALLTTRHKIAGTKRFVFASPIRDAHISDIRVPIKDVINFSGVQFTEHDLRRTFETTAESLDISYYTLKRLLNHKTGSDPTAGYIVTSAERMRSAAQKVADSLAESMEMPGSAGTKGMEPIRKLRVL